MSSCCINKILKDTIFSYYDEWTGRGIEPEIQITDKLLFMNGNEQGIQRIFQNIIKNGLDHGEKKISISLEEVENNIRMKHAVRLPAVSAYQLRKSWYFVWMGKSAPG